MEWITHMSIICHFDSGRGIKVNVMNKVALLGSAQHLFSLVLVREPQISDIGGDANQEALSVTLQHVTQAGQSESFFFRQCYECWETELPKPFINSHKIQCCCFGLPVATCSTHIQRSLF